MVGYDYKMDPVVNIRTKKHFCKYTMKGLMHMFYLSGNKIGNLLGVIDTEDHVEEFYTESFLRNCGVDL